MRRRAALKLAGLACAASLVALILVSNTQEHPRVTCTGHTCEEPFLKSPKDSGDRETSKNAESRFSPSQYNPNDFASGQDIFGRSTGNPGVGDLAQARTGVTVGANAGKVLDLTQFLHRNLGKEQVTKVEGHLHEYGGEEKGVHPGKEPNETVQDHLHGNVGQENGMNGGKKQNVKVEVHLPGNVGQENGISAGKEDGVKVEGHLRGNADQEKEINVEASDKPMGDHVTDRAKSYLEKLGVIKNLGKGARPLKSRKDLYSWRLKAPGAGNRNPAEQAPGTAQKVQISNKTGSVSGSERNGTAKIGAASTVSGDGSLGVGFGHLRDGSLQTGVAAAERATTNKAESAAGKQAGTRATNDDTNAVRDINSQGKDAGSVKDSVGAAESSNAQNPQSIIRAAAAPAENPTSPAQGAGANSTEADPRNTSILVLGKPSRPVGNSSVNNKDTAKSGGADSRSPTHRPGETVGNLLQRAGVITDQTNQTRSGEGEKGAAVAVPVGSDSAKSDPDTDRRKVCPEFTGGPGDVLFQLASAYAIARDRNMSLALPEKIANFSEAFRIDEDNMHGVITFDRSRCEQAADASNFKRGIYDEGFLKRITGKEDIKLRGFFQSYKYFERWEREVRDVLAFREDVLTKAMEAINILHFRKLGTSLYHSDTAEALDLVGVHVRRYPGDRRRREGLGYRTAPEDYVSFAMSEMKAWILNRDSPPDVRFFVVTDDPAWAESKLGLKALPDTMLVKGLDWAANLALLASMDDVIVTVGALGWWGAWLADGRSMYYQDFVKPGSEMDAAYLANDFFPPYWLGMS